MIINHEEVIYKALVKSAIRNGYDNGHDFEREDVNDMLTEYHGTAVAEDLAYSLDQLGYKLTNI